MGASRGICATKRRFVASNRTVPMARSTSTELVPSGAVPRSKTVPAGAATKPTLRLEDERRVAGAGPHAIEAASSLPWELRNSTRSQTASPLGGAGTPRGAGTVKTLNVEPSRNPPVSVSPRSPLLVAGAEQAFWSMRLAGATGIFLSACGGECAPADGGADADADGHLRGKRPLGQRLADVQPSYMPARGTPELARVAAGALHELDSVRNAIAGYAALFVCDVQLHRARGRFCPLAQLKPDIRVRGGQQRASLLGR